MSYENLNEEICVQDLVEKINLAINTNKEEDRKI